jgi:hypothetical protein
MGRHVPDQPPDDSFELDLHPHELTGGTETGGPHFAPLELTLADYKEIHQQLQGLSNDELKRIPVLAEGSYLEPGGTYLDLRDENAQEFTALAGMTAGPDNLYIPKREVDYVLWNRLRGVHNPARLDEADPNG